MSWLHNVSLLHWESAGSMRANGPGGDFPGGGGLLSLPYALCMAIAPAETDVNINIYHGNSCLLWPCQASSAFSV